MPIDNDGFSCFEILGYDVMLGDELRPWLIEVNHSPSFNIDSPLDLAIKEQLIQDTIQLARIDPKLISKWVGTLMKSSVNRSSLMLSGAYSPSIPSSSGSRRPRRRLPTAGCWKAQL